MEERQHGDVLEHRHEEYDYWHPTTRVHSEQPDWGLPMGHILAPVVPCSEEEEPPRGLQVQPFDWASWDAGCHAKGICQGYKAVPVLSEELEAKNLFQLLEHDILLPHYTPQYPATELHHRNVSPDLAGLAESYWQCPHCRQLQVPIQWVQGARLETYNMEVRGSRTVIWVKVSSGAWFVLIIRAYGTLQGVARGICDGTAYYCGIPAITEGMPPMQLPDECATILARRMWYRLTKGYWSDKKKEDDC
jgi:hypothetical protein